MSEAQERDKVHPIARRLRFIEASSFPRRLTIVLGVVAIALALVDVFHHRHALFTWEGWIGFHGVYGFAAFCVVVLTGWPLRRLLSRPENYYGEGDEDA
jgi:hypothetical protein